MPTEVSRKLATKTFNTPSGNIKVPVITEITFRDATERGQETTYTIDNSANSNRDVHVAWVAADPTNPQATENADPSTPAPTGLIAVERIDQWRKIDKVERGQEIFTTLDNKTYNPSGPPFFFTHLRTHVVSYRSDPTDPNDTNLISSELIDEFVFEDGSDRHQETHFYLDNPVDDDAANAQITPDLPDITDTANGVDPPYRTDPFQNIVRLSGQPMTVSWAYKPQAIGIESVPQHTGYHFVLQQGSSNSPWEFTDSQGRHIVVAGNFPVVPDVSKAPPSGEFGYQKWPWWYTGPNTDTNPTAGSTGQLTLSNGAIYFYDIESDTGNPTTGLSFSHTWPFFSDYWSPSGGFPLIWQQTGELSVTFGPITLTVDDVPWTLIKLHVSFAGVLETDGATPNSFDFNPFFSATFEPP